MAQVLCMPLAIQRRIAHIGVKTVFLRLSYILEGFSESDKALCFLLADARNRELHTGAMAFYKFPSGKWLPDFYRVADKMETSIDDPVWDERFRQWEQAWRWAIADSWLRKRSDIDYQEQLWQQRHNTTTQIAELLAEFAALRAWTYFFNRLRPKEAAALKGWRSARFASAAATSLPSY